MLLGVNIDHIATLRNARGGNLMYLLLQEFAKNAEQLQLQPT